MLIVLLLLLLEASQSTGVMLGKDHVQELSRFTSQLVCSSITTDGDFNAACCLTWPGLSPNMSSVSDRIRTGATPRTQSTGPRTWEPGDQRASHRFPVAWTIPGGYWAHGHLATPRQPLHSLAMQYVDINQANKFGPISKTYLNVITNDDKFY